MEARSCQMYPVTPEYVARVAHLDATLEEIAEAMKELKAEGRGNYY